MSEAALMPSVYIPHGGGPCFFMDWGDPDPWAPMAAFLRSLAGQLPERPKAILLISAHWEERKFSVGSGASPHLIYDYYGFPPHTYELTYPAAGNPALAAQVAELLGAAGISSELDPARGFDHGVFIPLKLVFPDADIPIVTLSLRADYDPAMHVAAGAALEPLRKQGVLILGSGMSVHNLNAMRDARLRAQLPAGAKEFDAWLSAAIEDSDPASRNAKLAAWESAPHARLMHPRRGEEHLLPLMVAAGAGGAGRGSKIFTDPVMGAPVSAFRFD